MNADELSLWVFCFSMKFACDSAEEVEKWIAAFNHAKEEVLYLEKNLDTYTSLLCFFHILKNFLSKKVSCESRRSLLDSGHSGCHTSSVLWTHMEVLYL